MPCWKIVTSTQPLCENCFIILQFFSQPIVESEKKRNQFFEGCAFTSSCSSIELPDKIQCHFWYKEAYNFLKHQLKHILFPSDINGVQGIDFVVGSDHSKGKFWMMMKMFPCYGGNREAKSFLFQKAEIDYPKDMTELLKNTVMAPLGTSLKWIKDGGQFIIQQVGEDNLNLSFVANEVEPVNRMLCSIPLCLFVSGDLKFYSQILGHENMKGCWWIWCKFAPYQWKLPASEQEMTHGLLMHLRPTKSGEMMAN